MGHDEWNDLDARIANAVPTRPYPSSVKIGGRWQDRHARPVVPVVDEPLDEIRANDRRIAAIVGIVVALMFAAGILLLLVAPHEAPSRCRLAACSVPSDLRGKP